MTQGNETLLPRLFLRVQEGGVGEDLDDRSLDEIRGLIHPEVVIAPATEQGSLFTAPAIDSGIKVMDRRQERLAKKLGSGHRVIRGVAGSGKTLVLVYRARLLAELLPSQKISSPVSPDPWRSLLRAQLADLQTSR